MGGCVKGKGNDRLACPYEPVVVGLFYSAVFQRALEQRLI